MTKGMTIKQSSTKVTKFDAEYKDYKLHIYVEERNDSFESFFSVDEWAYTLCLTGINKARPDGHWVTEDEFMEMFYKALDRIDERLEWYFEDIDLIEELADIEMEGVE